MNSHSTEAATRADFSIIRYAQCWEDADVLLEAMDIRPGDTCVSIASAGDNTFSMLTRNPARVIGIDLNPAQIACCELRRAAYQKLDHNSFLELLGARPSRRRLALFDLCEPLLPESARAFWSTRRATISAGAATAGKFEHYFRTFSTRVLPWVHSGRRVDALLKPKSVEERRRFYADHWDTWRWRWMFRIFFSRAVMGRLGRDPAFFKYVEGSVAARILERGRYALTELEPADNPYLTWILKGRLGDALPHALRPEHFATIRDRIDRIEFRPCTLEAVLADEPALRPARLNLSDIFEYMSPQATDAILSVIADRCPSGGRAVYWNMLVPRSHGDGLAARWRLREDLSGPLLKQDKAFFYSRLVIEERL
jgi:S-adenosylmethionine-diacylglycerol 3-amino-3-carboxypropyl transferase